MGLFRDTASITLAGSTSPIPAALNLLSSIQASSFSITNGIATIVLGSSLPVTGYEGPNFAIGAPAGSGQQVILYGFSTATYFNGKKVTVLSNNGTNSFSFAFTHTNVGSTSDSGYAAPCLFEHYRAVRIEVDQNNGSDFVYVGDLNVSTTQYVAALSVSGQLAIEISSENIPAEGIWMVSTADTDKVHVSFLY
jgi:hypothetical protein